MDDMEKICNTGLVLEGGAMRGMFSVGVMDVMMEHGVEFDGIVGVSAGATFGCNYKTRLCQAAQAHQGRHRQTAPTIAELALQTDRSMEQDMRNSHR